MHATSYNWSVWFFSDWLDELCKLRGSVLDLWSGEFACAHFYPLNCGVAFILVQAGFFHGSRPCSEGSSGGSPCFPIAPNPPENNYKLNYK